MKKITAFLFGCLFVVTSLTQAQVITFGPAISANVLWAQIDDNDIAVTPIPSYSLGGFARVKILKLYIQPEVFYARKGVDFLVHNASSNQDLKQQLRYQTVDVNLMLGLQLFKLFHDDIGIRLHTGPGMNHNLDNSFVVNGNKIDDSVMSFKPNAFNWQAGLGVDVMNRFFVDFRYGVTLSDIVDSGSYTIIPYFGTVQIAYKLIKDK
ncbi:MAG TPA: outer membrane beta-barrel protein [Cytophagaceae bacterium]|nr:outer membrane beta-barrel protein [Cytophagaceae bacterium]